MPTRINLIAKTTLTLASFWLMTEAGAQETIRYTGKTIANIDYHHGLLPLAIGTHSYQTFRANRAHPETAKGLNWTYNHAPMIAYWNEKFYLSYLSNPAGEHIPPGQSFYQTSSDGKEWSEPEILFPIYPVPDGIKKEGNPNVSKNLDAVMHQRMTFYTASSGRLLALGYYGVALDVKDHPNDGQGIGRVVREIYRDGNLGPIYFIRKNSFWSSPTLYPDFEKSTDKGFVSACKELLSQPLMMMQWVEEADRDDPLIPLKKQFKAFSYYHLPDGKVVGLWKNALTSISGDGGKTWNPEPVRAPGFVNSNAKIWGQKTSDGRYATVYNPSEFRWPLALSVSHDGILYENLLTLNGQVTSMRYGGNYKSYGPQYVRGITEGNGTPPDGKLWTTYSMNKEDIWVSSVPVPITDSATAHASDQFTGADQQEALGRWNIYSPLWAPVALTDGGLSLEDEDPFDYALAERVIPRTTKIATDFTIIPGQHNTGHLDIELQNDRGQPGIRLSFEKTGQISVKGSLRSRQNIHHQDQDRCQYPAVHR
jgi:hypothetical protein